MMWISFMPTRRAVVLLVIAGLMMFMLLVNTIPAAAHAGHAHAEAEGGFTIVPTLEVAGTVAVLGLAYLVVSRVYRDRERSVARPPGNKDVDQS